MAKKTKSQKKTKKLEEKVADTRQEVKPGQHLFVMSDEEVFSLVQILAFSKDIFKQMSLNCAKDGDAKAEGIYAARSELSEILFDKIRTIASIGEPTSRALH